MDTASESSSRASSVSSSRKRSEVPRGRPARHPQSGSRGSNDSLLSSSTVASHLTIPALRSAAMNNDDAMSIRSDATVSPLQLFDRPDKHSVILQPGQKYNGMLWGLTAEQYRLYGPYVHKAPALSEVVKGHGWKLINWTGFDEIPNDEKKKEDERLAARESSSLVRPPRKCSVCARGLTEKSVVMADGHRYSLFEQYPCHVDCLVRYFEGNAINRGSGMVIHLDGYLPSYPVEVAAVNKNGYVKSHCVNSTNARYRSVLMRGLNKGLPRILNPQRLSVRDRLPRVLQFALLSPLNSFKSCVPTTVGGTLSIHFRGQRNDKKKTHPTKWVGQKRRLIEETTVVTSKISRLSKRRIELERDLKALRNEMEHCRIQHIQLTNRLSELKACLDEDSGSDDEQSVPLTGEDDDSVVSLQTDDDVAQSQSGSSNSSDLSTISTVPKTDSLSLSDVIKHDDELPITEVSSATDEELGQYVGFDEQELVSEVRSIAASSSSSNSDDIWDDSNLVRVDEPSNKKRRTDRV